ncbi:hypothetical protein K503DRAFT_149297 [Rhizopogon vinicolor AM-OR11-026]|uniref:Uncharacterized protein n=1 Tax=Rhizopogon vinicolor AM-OR11-026 TaxID=1314800 RepID=A0A1B7N133_9AGAM|nr:hypothetical protein K503DRAFT_149297 [Rhizopogon vinicolor AM-OR11-026]
MCSSRILSIHLSISAHHNVCSLGVSPLSVHTSTYVPYPFIYPSTISHFVCSDRAATPACGLQFSRFRPANARSLTVFSAHMRTPLHATLNRRLNNHSSEHSFISQFMFTAKWYIVLILACLVQVSLAASMPEVANREYEARDIALCPCPY